MTTASKIAPHLQGFLVTSKVQRSIILEEVPYWLAARIMPEVFPMGYSAFQSQIEFFHLPFPRI